MSLRVKARGCWPLAIAFGLSCSRSAEPPPPAAREAGTELPSAEAPAPAWRDRELSFERQGAKLVARGQIPSMETRRQIEARARPVFRAIDGRDLFAAAGPTRESYAPTLELMLDALLLVDPGAVELRGTELTIHGVILEADRAALAALGERLPDPYTFSAGALVDRKEAQRCREDALALVEGHAEIDATMADEIAALGRRCPAPLRFSFHTSSEGPLPERRARTDARSQALDEALRAHGLGPDDFAVASKGADLPLASNDTAEGRAQNERIEVELMVPRP